MKNITIKITTKKLLDRKGKEIKTPQGETHYEQHDSTSLLQLLAHFDNTKYKLSDYRNYLNLQDKVNYCWKKDEGKIELSLEEAGFLKDYLINFKDKATPNTRLTSFTLRTLVGIVDQLK